MIQYVSLALRHPDENEGALKSMLRGLVQRSTVMSAKQTHLFTNQTKKKTAQSVRNPASSGFQKNAINDILAKDKEEDERLRELAELREREKLENEKRARRKKEEDEKKKAENARSKSKGKDDKKGKKAEETPKKEKAGAKKTEGKPERGRRQVDGALQNMTLSLHKSLQRKTPNSNR